MHDSRIENLSPRFILLSALGDRDSTFAPRCSNGAARVLRQATVSFFNAINLRLVLVGYRTTLIGFRPRDT